MSEPEDPLAGVDLDAWQPPSVPDGIADAVLRRMREPIAVAAHEHEIERPRRRWPLWLGGGALVAAATAGALAVAPWRSPAPPVAERGDVVADRASHVEIGASSAEVDAGAQLSWRREPQQRFAVAQLRGAVTWRVAADDTFLIDAGAMGASVEASGASLRVEVDMRITSSDGRVVAASVFTAAAVALVTVVVYQGHVKVASGGQTVNVGAGGAVEIKPGEAPRAVHEVAAVAPAEPRALPSGSIKPGELEALRLSGEKNIMPDEYVKRAIATAGDDLVRVIVKLCLDTTGKVSDVTVLKSGGYPGYDEKIVTETRAWTFKPYLVNGAATPVCAALQFRYKQG